MGKKKQRKAVSSSEVSTVTASSSRLSSLKSGIEDDDRVIKILEKKLGFKKKKNAPARCFTDFGLGDVWSIIEQVDTNGSDNTNVAKKQLNKRKRKYDEDDDYREDEKDTDESDSEEIEDEFDDDHEEKSVDDSTEIDNSVSDEEDEQLKEDIYGRLVDKKGNLIKVEAPKKQFNVTINEEVDAQLLKRIVGLINRLTSSNLMTISTDIENTLKDYSLYQLTMCLNKCINNQLIRDTALAPQRLVADQAMLVAVLHTNIGDEIGGHVIHFFIKQFDTLLNQLPDDNKKAEESKKLDNTVAFISYLCACNVIDTSLMFDVMDRLTQQFNDKCIQVILLTLRMIGFVLRRGDPGRLKKMIISIQSKAATYETRDKRIIFMLEALTAIKNNNVAKLNSLNEDGPIASVDLPLLRSTLKNGLRDKTSVSPIPGNYDEILKSNRWWIKSGLLLENQPKEKKKSTSEDKTPSTGLDSIEVKDSLCSKLRLVTPLRKTIFKALVTCEDYVECCQRLIKIGGKQFIEVINVVLLVALREKKFNPFYVYLFKQLAGWDRKYKMSLIYSLRDKLCEIERLSKIEKTNLAELMSELLKRNVIPITVLKNIQFSDLDEMTVELLRTILIPVFTSDQATLSNILSKMKPKDPFATALRLFISCFMDPQYKEKMLFLTR